MPGLVRHVNQRIAPGGGPPGYLHNLRRAVADRGSRDELRIEVTTVPTPGPGHGMSWPRRAAAAIASVPGIRRLNYEIQGDFGLRFKHVVADWRSHYAAVDRHACQKLLACDLLFVHDTFLAEALRAHSPREARDKVVLVTHAPTFYAHQIAGDLLPDAPEQSWRDQRVVRSLRVREVDIMQSVRAVAWPFPEAQEGYAEWQAVARDHPARNVFIRTGVPRPETARTRQVVRDAWGVADTDRVALFMGRPHTDKGFWRYLDWAEAASHNPSRWIFAFAGQEPKHSRRDLSALRRLGYQSDNGGAYLAADLVVIPNRHSYLDIGLLECLALGVPVATTAVGGHRAMLRLSPAIGQIPEGSPADVWGRLEVAASEMAPPESHRARVDLWREMFSPDTFVDEHLRASAALLA
jgi:glycosyltransferase involved in cell wall biosynthesis